MTLPPTAKLADQEVFNPGSSPLQRTPNPSPAGPTHIVAGSSGETPTTSFAGMLDPATETFRVTAGPPYTEACADDCAVGRPARSEPSSSEPVGVGRRRQLERDWRSPPACGLDSALAPMSLRAATHSRLCAKSSTPGESRVVAGCHFAVRLNHLIPGSRSYSVAVILKWQSGITLGGGPSTTPSTTRCAGGTSRRKDIGVPHAAPLLGTKA